jgi:hypothetical protein
MKNKIYKATVLVGILGNVGVGISYLVTGVLTLATMHIACGLVFIPMYLELKNDDKKGI